MKSTPFFTCRRTSAIISSVVLQRMPMLPSTVPVSSGYQSVRPLLVVMYRPAEVMRGPFTRPSLMPSRTATPMK